MEAIAVRSATLADAPALGALAEPDDYIPNVLDEWLTDESGAVIVAESDGTPVGMAHIVMAAADEAWLDGVRVRPDDRQRGVGGALARRCLVWARERGASVVRCCVTGGNTPSQRMIERAGFSAIGAYVPFEAPAAGAETDPRHDYAVSQPGPDALDRLWAWLERSNVAPLVGGLLLPGGIGVALTDERLASALAERSVWLAEAWGETTALAIADARRPSGRPELFSIAYLDGAADAISRLALVLRSVAAARGYDAIDARPPDLLIVHDALAGAGFARMDSDTHALYAADLA